MKLLNKTQLIKAMDQFCTKGIFDKKKIADSTKKDELKNLIQNLVRKREPLVIDFVKQFEKDQSFIGWLYAMGYNRTKAGRKFVFLCTCENQFNIN